MTKIYIAVCMDRHISPVTKPFTTSVAAIAYAFKFAVDHAAHPEYINITPIEEWLYHCEYSTEGDYVYVIEEELDP